MDIILRDKFNSYLCQNFHTPLKISLEWSPQPCMSLYLSVFVSTFTHLEYHWNDCQNHVSLSVCDLRKNIISGVGPSSLDCQQQTIERTGTINFCGYAIPLLLTRRWQCFGAYCTPHRVMRFPLRYFLFVYHPPSPHLLLSNPPIISLKQRLSGAHLPLGRTQEWQVGCARFLKSDLPTR